MIVFVYFFVVMPRGFRFRFGDAHVVRLVGLVEILPIVILILRPEGKVLMLLSLVLEMVLEVAVEHGLVGQLGVDEGGVGGEEVARGRVDQVLGVLVHVVLVVVVVLVIVIKIYSITILLPNAPMSAIDLISFDDI